VDAPRTGVPSVPKVVTRKTPVHGSSWEGAPKSFLPTWQMHPTPITNAPASRARFDSRPSTDLFVNEKVEAIEWEAPVALPTTFERVSSFCAELSEKLPASLGHKVRNLASSRERLESLLDRVADRLNPSREHDADRDVGDLASYEHELQTLAAARSPLVPLSVCGVVVCVLGLLALSM